MRPRKILSPARKFNARGKTITNREIQIEITFNRIVRVSREKQALAERGAKTASMLPPGMPPPTVHFFEIVEPTRNPEVIVLETRALGFYLNGEIYTRNDLLPGAMVKNIFHEVAHAALRRAACKTLRLPYSEAADERAARLFCYEHLSGLQSNATTEGALEFLDKLEKRFSQQLRERMKPLVAQANQRIIATNRIKWAPRGVEFR